MARRLNAPVTFLRGVVLLGSFLSPDLFYVYVAAVLLLPRQGRSVPGAANVVGALRIGLLVAVVWVTFSGGVSVDDLFKQSPEIWIPQTALCLIPILVLLASGPGREAQDRAIAAAALAVLAVAGAMVVGMILAPGFRWERAVSVATVLLGAAVVTRGRRGDGRTLLVPTVIAGERGSLAGRVRGATPGGNRSSCRPPAQYPSDTARLSAGDRECQG